MPNIWWMLVGRSAHSRSPALFVQLIVTPGRIYVCDVPSKYDALKETYKGVTPCREHGSNLVPLLLTF